MATVKIGYQGVPGSYSEEAAINLMTESGIEDYQLISLVSSARVAQALKSKTVDLGVVATQNTVGGQVQETNEAFYSDEWTLKNRHILPIRHCLFVKDSSITPAQVTHVASHIQALTQCRQTMQEVLGDYEEREYEDTAGSARALKEGEFPDSTAVLCSRRAGELNELHLLQANVQDHSQNSTQFVLVEYAGTDSKKSLWDRVIGSLVYSEQNFKQLVKLVIAATLLLAFPVQKLNNAVLGEMFQIELYEALVFSAGLSVVLLGLLESYRKAQGIQRFVGYWIYMDRVRPDVKDDNQNYAIPRVVRIDKCGNKLRIRGWLCSSPPERYFEAKEVLFTNPFSNKGTLVYKYSNFLNASDWNFNGIVELEWSQTEQDGQIKNLFGRYYGFLTNTTGSINFKRLSKEQFLEISHLDEHMM
ncbi:prephenate dehydratase [Pseudidiomarina aestuarii]|uniref:prephenate dehydratase n=1 Tax=Pseudidiomarina aestuarii TaxID=624146 RepID=UPI003A9816DC